MLKTNSILISLILLTGCSSAGIKHRVGDAWLAGVKEEPNLKRAARDLQEAKENQRSSEHELKLARLALFKAETGRELNDERLEREREVLEASLRYQSKKDADRTGVLIDALKRTLSANALEIEWRETDVEHAEVNVELAKARVHLADAQLESTRATLAQKKDASPETAISMADFKGQLAEALNRVSGLETDAGDLWEDVKKKKAKHDEALAKLPALLSEDKQLLTKSQDENKVLTSNLDAMMKKVKRLEEENRELKNQIHAKSSAANP